jgi:alpha-ketoglutarate-dependent taurine dioxygenase
MKETERQDGGVKAAPAPRRKYPQPKAVRAGADGFIKTSPLETGLNVPLVVEPQLEGLDLAAWASHHREFIEANLFRHGGILFRGFEMRSQEDFQRFLDATTSHLVSYTEGATPRTELGGNVYTSTEYPAEHSIGLHNELTYVMTWPLRICFFCLTSAEQGGETPIADVRNVYRRIDPLIVKRFREKGWMLLRNFGDGLSLPWEVAFRTNDKAQLETYCRAARIEYEWKSGGGLRTRQVRPATAIHPRTSAVVWFNHIAFWHVSSLDPQVREVMLSSFKEEELPYNTYYGDGSPIEDHVVHELREAYRRETVAVPWRRGDLLMLENMLVAHGRHPFSGPRRILVAMAEPFTRQDF